MTTNSNPEDKDKNSGVLSQIVSAVVIALLVGGAAPWWYNEFLKKKTPPSSELNISGRWLNPTLGYRSEITQDGNRFRFTTRGMLQRDYFESSGSGTINQKNIEYDYVTQYQSGRSSEGNCSGTVSESGTRMTSTCTDSIWGTFVASTVRQ